MKVLMILALALTLTGRAFADGDVIELKNGDRISGSIVKFEGDTIIIDTPYSAKLKIDWMQVETINSSAPHMIRLKPDRFVKGRLVKAAGGIQIESEDIRSARTITPEEIVSIDVPPGAQWEGRIAAAIGGTSGNYPHNFTVGGIGEVIRRSDTDRLRLGIAGDYGETQAQEPHIATTGPNAGKQDGVTNLPRTTTASNVRGWGAYDYNLDSHWSLGGQLKLEHDRIKDLNLRSTVAAGPRYRFFDTKTEYLSVYLGGAYINENYINPDTKDRDFVSLALGDEFHWKFPWGFRIEQTLDVYPNLQDTSDVLFSFYLGPRYTLPNGLFTGLGFNWDYDTKPAQFRDRSDFRYLANLGYEF